MRYISKSHKPLYCALLLVALMVSVSERTLSWSGSRSTSPHLNLDQPECQGDACGLISITWDSQKEQYKVQNNSTEQWVRVEAANLVSNATICLAPSKSDYLTLSSVVGTVRAVQAPESCGKKI